MFHSLLIFVLLVDQIIDRAEVRIMDDVISRQQAIDEIKEIYEWHDNVTKERIIEHFERLPSAQTERKGHWVYAGTDYHTGDDWYTCSECEAIDEHYMSPYCWHCGCRMEGDDE